MTKYHRALVAAVGVAAFAAASNAQLVAYTDQAAWEADLAAMGYAATTETFDGLDIPNMQPDGGPYIINSDVSLTVLGQQGSADDAFIANGEFHGEIFPDSEHTAYVHDFGTAIIGFGQYFEGAASGLGIRIQTNEGTIDIFDDGGYDGFDNGFLGFIATSPLTQVSIIGSDADGGSAVGEIYDAADLSYAVIPAPAGVALLGLGGLVAARRRR
jgi:hypothetical protein